MNKYFENLSYGTYINISYNDSPEYFPPHWHSDIEIIAPLQNGVCITIDAVKYDLGERDAIIVFPGEIHNIASNSEGKSIVVQFSPTLLTALDDFRQNFRLLSRHHLLSDAEMPDVTRELIALLKDMLVVYLKNAVFGEAEIYARLLAFFVVFGRFCLENSIDGGIYQKKVYTEKLADICSYISENCTQSLSLEGVAGLFGFSKFYFSRIFKRYTGVSFWNFVTEVRVRKAEQMLAESDALVADVALRSGFGSITAFNRVFKEIKSMTPKEYRKLYLKNNTIHRIEQ
ncbi:MAG: AraC family transcriptional regulator [Clostridiales bacterium]|nr:AraC family transcriptional regulator [Clostridiales bacterium]